MSSSTVPFSCLQSFPASRSFPMNKFFASGAKVLEFSFSINPSNEHSGLISFRMDWLDLLAVQGTLKSLLQYQFKSIILWCSTFFIVQLSHPYMTTGPWLGRSPSMMVGGEKSHLESNPIPTRDAQRAQTNLVHTRTRRLHRD